MATFAEIKETRLAISDPGGVIDIVDSGSALPSTAAPQTAYLVSDIYYVTDEVGSVVETDFEVADLRVSDSSIEAWIDADDTDTAKCKAIKQILSVLLRELNIVRTSTGAESTDYADLKTVYYGYKDLLAIYTETVDEDAGNSTGRWYATATPTIAGGDL